MTTLYAKIVMIVKRIFTGKIILYAILAFLFVLTVMAYTTYDNNRNEIIDQQHQHLLTISRSTCRSLEIYVGEKVDCLKILALNDRFAFAMKNENRLALQSYFCAYLEAQKEDVRRVYEINKAGKIVYQHPEPTTPSFSNSYAVLSKDIERVLAEKSTYIGRAKKDEDGQYVINIFEPVFYDREFIGIIVGAVSLNMMYEKLVKPVKAGKEGYAMVKDRDGIILMHPAEDQIGIDVIATRKERHPDFEFHELESLIEQQFANEEGTTIYHSYWWTDKKPQKTKKLNAFSRAYIGEEFWIVAMALSYNELEGPIRQHLVKIVQVAFVIILIISVAIFIILKIQKNKEALEVETKYLKELNATTEELRKKDLQLQHSQKLQALGTLTGGIAHEFNNLLTPILGYTEILKKSVAIDSKDYEYINEIYDASRKAKNIIEQILVFSRLDRNTTKYEPIQVSLLVEETLNLIRPTLTSNIKISYEDSSDGSCIMANQVQIHQVLLNLYNNAFHAMKDAEGVLKVTLSTVKRNEAPENYTSASETEEYVQITVSDSGYGMSAEAVTRIFEPFFTTKGLGEGTGLGLFVVQGIVRNHKGLITVESVVDKGSTFKVYFPKVQGTPSVAEEEKIEFKKLKGLKPVLMVDDNPKVLKVMKKGLEDFGLEVLAETNSVEALNIFKQDPSRFEVVITDQAMPDLRGVELAERLKKLNPRVKIILVTGYADEKVAEYMKCMIIDGYLNKPVIGKQMAKAVCDVLEKDY